MSSLAGLTKTAEIIPQIPPPPGPEILPQLPPKRGAPLGPDKMAPPSAEPTDSELLFDFRVLELLFVYRALELLFIYRALELAMSWK